MFLLFCYKSLLILTIILLLYGIIVDKHNAVFLFLFFELLIILAIVLLTIQSIAHYNSFIGVIFFIFVIGLAAIKAAIGLSVIVSWVKHRGTLNIF